MCIKVVAEQVHVENALNLCLQYYCKIIYPLLFLGGYINLQSFCRITAMVPSHALLLCL
jgi:hypothetical protein